MATSKNIETLHYALSTKDSFTTERCIPNGMQTLIFEFLEILVYESTKIMPKIFYFCDIFIIVLCYFEQVTFGNL